MTISPSLPNHTRQVTPSIRTSLFQRRRYPGDSWVSAVYTNPRGSLIYTDPRDAPRYAASILPAGQGRPGKWNGKWECVVRMQAVEQTETAALAALAAALDEARLPYEHAALRAAILALACATGDTPHELCPMGARRPKPRRRRVLWTDKTTGKRIHIYPETMKPHADPNCICALCTVFDRPTTKENESAQK